MGSYASIIIKNKELYIVKNCIDFNILNIFSLDEYSEKISFDEYNEEIITRKFTTKCCIARKRLEIIGYTLDRIKEEIEKNMQFARKMEDYEYPTYLYDILSKFYNYIDDIPDFELISKMSIENILSTISNFFIDDNKEVAKENKLLDFILRMKDEDYGIGLPVINKLSEIRLILEALNDDELIEYDITEIIDNGYISIDEIKSFWTNRDFNNISNNTIIIAEGTNDIYVLKNSLKILFPQFEHLYSFFDFDNVSSPGSTSSLVNLIKGFISSGIEKRTIAVFDNDTAAYEALSSFDMQKLTPNIRIMHLPNLEWAKSYPTLGPTGKDNIDINELACSIELFLGKNLLQVNGEYIPVQCKGYNSKLNRYQGEILNKNEINIRFKKVVNMTIEQGIDNVEHDWEQLIYLWEVIFNIFND